MIRPSISLLVIFFCKCALLHAQNKPIKVYLLGAFHFAQTDSTYNVLDEKHQKSIQRVNDLIVGIHPDKIFIEAMPDFENEHKLDSLFTAYTQRTKETNNPNEIWQIGFKVAKRLGHPKLYQCDHPGSYGSLYAELEEYAATHQQTNILHYNAPGVTKPLGNTLDRDSLMQSMSLLDYLKWLNSKEVQGTSHAHYINLFPRIGQTDVYDYQKNYLLGTELTADWYRRNIYIYSKMVNQLNYQEKAIFLLIGNDHVPIIRHLFESNPFFEVVPTKKWLK